MESYFAKIETRDNRALLYVALKVWQNLKFANPDLSEPDVCLGDHNDVIFTWSNNEHYLECEIFALKRIEFFYRNKIDNSVWGDDMVFDEHTPYLTNGVIHRLKIFEV